MATRRGKRRGSGTPGRPVLRATQSSRSTPVISEPSPAALPPSLGGLLQAAVRRTGGEGLLEGVGELAAEILAEPWLRENRSSRTSDQSSACDPEIALRRGLPSGYAIVFVRDNA